MFQKRHYEAIATVIQNLNFTEDELYRRELIAQEFADMLKTDSPKFKYARFCRACEPGANVRART